MTPVDTAHTDPHRAVKGWIQDYWMLRLLDPRGLDLHGGGGPFNREVGLRKGDARLQRSRTSLSASPSSAG